MAWCFVRLTFVNLPTDILRTKILYLIITFCLSNVASAQKMEEEEKYHFGVIAGLTTSWYRTDKLNVQGDSVRYSAKPHAGFTVSLYSRQKMTNFFRPFYNRREIKNWYWQAEISGSYRGCNFNYYEGPKDSLRHFIYNNEGKVSSYTKSSEGRFNKMSTFGLELPIMLVWDIGNKQTHQVLFGADINYLISWEFYKANDPFPVYFDPGGYKEDFFDKFVNPHRWNSSGLLGYQYSGDVCGFRAMMRWGFLDVNNKIVVDYNKLDYKPTHIIHGYLIPVSIDLSIVF